jgi:hypothetical protein
VAGGFARFRIEYLEKLGSNAGSRV